MHPPLRPPKGRETGSKKEVLPLRIQESAENYLETIHKLRLQNGQVRSIDIATTMGFSKPSVSYAMKQFRENGYILVDDMGYITLTDSGRQIAERIFDRHTTISRFLMALGVEGSLALEDACKMEHDLSEESYLALKRWLTENEK